MFARLTHAKLQKLACARTVAHDFGVHTWDSALDMCKMHVCMSGRHMPNLDYVYMQIVSQGQRNKLHKHVYVLRCNPPHDTRRKFC